MGEQRDDDPPVQEFTTINWRSPYIWAGAGFGVGCYVLLTWLVLYVILSGE